MQSHNSRKDKVTAGTGETVPTFPDRLIRMPQVREICPLSKPSIYRLISEGKFPPPVSLGGGRAVAWLRREVEAFVREQVQKRDAERVRPAPECATATGTD